MHFKKDVKTLRRYLTELGVHGTLDKLFSRFSTSDIALVHVRNISSPLFYRKRSCDYDVIRQIFVDQELNTELPSDPCLIIDAGANIGCASIWFANRFPNAQIIAIEPDGINSALCRLNCYPYPNVTVVEAALWSKRANLRITNPDDAPLEYRVSEYPFDVTSNAIRGISIPDLLEDSKFHMIDILKMDIEGSEEKVLSENTDWISCLDTLIIEFHERIAPGCNESLVGNATSREYVSSASGEYTVFRFSTPVSKPKPCSVSSGDATSTTTSGEATHD